MSFTVRPVRPEDAAAWLRMRQMLWPADEDEHRLEIQRFFQGERVLPAEVLLACDQAGRAVGFAELSIRSIVEGCQPGEVAFLEGWYVEAGFRRRGLGAMLVRAAEAWGRAQGCTEFGSDTDIDNAAAVAAHLALGFEETARNVCFRKSL